MIVTCYCVKLISTVAVRCKEVGIVEPVARMNRCHTYKLVVSALCKLTIKGIYCIRENNFLWCCSRVVNGRVSISKRIKGYFKRTACSINEANIIGYVLCDTLRTLSEGYLTAITTLLWRHNVCLNCLRRRRVYHRWEQIRIGCIRCHCVLFACAGNQF